MWKDCREGPLTRAGGPRFRQQREGAIAPRVSGLERRRSSPVVSAAVVKQTKCEQIHNQCDYLFRCGHGIETLFNLYRALNTTRQNHLLDGGGIPVTPHSSRPKMPFHRSKVILVQSWMRPQQCPQCCSRNEYGRLKGTRKNATVDGAAG